MPVANGGTGTTDGFGWKNAYTATEFNKKIGLTYSFTTQELVTAIINTFKEPVFCMVTGWSAGENKITDFPSSIYPHRTIINYADSNRFYLETTDPHNLTTYICNVSNGVAGPWIQIRNFSGTLPTNVFANDSIPAAAIQSVASSKVTGLATVATSGSYNDLTNKPTIPTNVAPLPIPTGSGLALGLWYNLVLNQSNNKLPDGGTWAYIGCLKGGSPDVGFFFDTGVKEGGTPIDILSNTSAPYFIWRVQ